MQTISNSGEHQPDYTFNNQFIENEIKMFTFRGLLLTLLLTLTASLAHAREPLLGAFGIELGKKLNSTIYEPLKPIPGFEEAVPVASVSIHPPTPNDLFRTYYAKILRSNNTVIAIEASKFVQGKSNCLSNLKNIGRFLAGKYGGEFEIVEGGEWRRKMYLFALVPPSSPNLIGGGCYDTGLVDNGFEERGIFDTEEDATFNLKITFGTRKYFGSVSQSGS